MNRIVREHYPVAELPEDLRREFSDFEHVRVVLEPVVDHRPPTTPSLDDLFARARPTYADFQEVVDHVEALRGDWD